MKLLAAGKRTCINPTFKRRTRVTTFNTGLVDEHHIAPDNGYAARPGDSLRLEVLEFDPLPPGEENHLTFKGAFPTATFTRPGSGAT